MNLNPSQFSFLELLTMYNIHLLVRSSTLSPNHSFLDDHQAQKIKEDIDSRLENVKADEDNDKFDDKFLP